jgi:hypothetical protein
MTKEEVEFKTNLDQKIKDYIGKKVTVYIGLKDRTTFDDSISVSGTLEQHPELNDHYRVITIDDSTYSYFTDSVVKRIVGHPTHTFKNGAVAVIQIEIKTQY